MEKKKKTLLDYRNELDAIDTAILERFEERMAVCGQIAELKSELERARIDNGELEEKLARMGRSLAAARRARYLSTAGKP